MKRDQSIGKQTRTKKFTLTEKITGVNEKTQLYAILEKRVYEYNVANADGEPAKTLNLPRPNESNAMFWSVNEEGTITCGLKIKQLPTDKKSSSTDPAWGFLLDVNDGKWKGTSSIRSSLQNGDLSAFSIDGEEAKILTKSLINVCSATKHPDLLAIVNKFV